MKIAGKLANVFLANYSANGIYVAIEENSSPFRGQLIINKKPKKIQFSKEYLDQLKHQTSALLHPYLKLWN